MDPLIPAILMQSPDKILYPSASCGSFPALRRELCSWSASTRSFLEGYDGFEQLRSASGTVSCGTAWMSGLRVGKHSGGMEAIVTHHPVQGVMFLPFRFPTNVTAGYRMGLCTCDCWICAGLNWLWSLPRKAKPCALIDKVLQYNLIQLELHCRVWPDCLPG